MIFSVTDPRRGSLEPQDRCARSRLPTAAACTLDIAWNEDRVHEHRRHGGTRRSSPVRHRAGRRRRAAGPGARPPGHRRSRLQQQSTIARASTVGRKVYFVSNGAHADSRRHDAGRVRSKESRSARTCPLPAPQVDHHQPHRRYHHHDLRQHPGEARRRTSRSAPAQPAPSCRTSAGRSSTSTQVLKGCHDDREARRCGRTAPQPARSQPQREPRRCACVPQPEPDRRAVPALDDRRRMNGPETPIDFKVMVHSIHAGGVPQDAVRRDWTQQLASTTTARPVPGRAPEELPNCHVRTRAAEVRSSCRSSRRAWHDDELRRANYQIAAGATGRSIDVESRQRPEDHADGRDVLGLPRQL